MATIPERKRIRPHEANANQWKNVTRAMNGETVELLSGRNHNIAFCMTKVGKMYEVAEFTQGTSEIHARMPNVWEAYSELVYQWALCEAYIWGENA